MANIPSKRTIKRARNFLMEIEDYLEDEIRNRPTAHMTPRPSREMELLGKARYYQAELTVT